MQATFIITGILIDDENLKENVMDNSGNMSVYPYNKIDGVKYYYEEIGDRWFSIKNVVWGAFIRYYNADAGILYCHHSCWAGVRV